MRILVADDEEMNRSLLEALLARLGHSTITTDSARGALGILLNPNTHGTVDCLMTDNQMPTGNDGLELLANIKTIWPSTGLPTLATVFMSGRAYESGYKAMALGAIVLPKPFDMNALKEVIREAEKRVPKEPATAAK